MNENRPDRQQRSQPPVDLPASADLEKSLGDRSTFCHIVADPPAMGALTTPERTARCGEAGPFTIVPRAGKRMCPDCLRREAEARGKP